MNRFHVQPETTGLMQRIRRIALPSAITSTSEGPAGISIAAPEGSPLTRVFAHVTQALPGPKILQTLGTDSVPYAMAAIACAPPTLKMSLTPSALQQQ